jgi:hypothetical protein
MVIENSPKMPVPSVAVALAVMTPLLIAVTSPDELMVAREEPLLSDHVTVVAEAFEGDIAALSCAVPLSAVIVAGPEILMLVTATNWLVIVITN